MRLRLLTTLCFIAMFSVTISAKPPQSWPMAGGPDGSWRVTGDEPPLNWSVRTGENIFWKTTLPEGGQSGITVWGDRVFLTTMKPFKPKVKPEVAQTQLENSQRNLSELVKVIDPILAQSNAKFKSLSTQLKEAGTEIDSYLKKNLSEKVRSDAKSFANAINNLSRRDNDFKPLHAKQQGILKQIDQVRVNHSKDYKIEKASLDANERLVKEVSRIYGADIDAYCLDAKSGKILWKVQLTGTADAPYNYGFSDSSSPTPIADGKHVWFCNASGSMGCWTVAGKQVWTRQWIPSGHAPFNKQFEPVKHGNTILNVEPLDFDDSRRKEGEPQWNYIRGIDVMTGKTLWISDDAITHYNTPVFGTMNDSTPAVLQGRGGPHAVPETPVGLSMTRLEGDNAGKTIWQFEPTDEVTTPYGALANQHWDNQYAYWLKAGELELKVLDVDSGKLLRSLPLTKNVTERAFDKTKNEWTTNHLDQISGVTELRHTNIVAGGHYYFLLRAPGHRICRVNIESGKTEYLELPAQVIQGENGKPDEYVWGEVQANDTRNSRGLDVAADKRIKLGGFTKSFLGPPTAVNDKIYFTTMIGLTYVIDANAKDFDQSAILAVNDIGPVGMTWTVNSISYAGGKLFHRSMKEVICIGAE
ncbi:MAG: outer membrane protein assembly factor BamB family protein [Pirellulales bacterium]